MENISKAQKEYFSNHGFGEDGLTWCVFGDNTYSIKSELKRLGCRYSSLLKWHAAAPLDLPAGYGMFSISFDDIMEWDEAVKNAFYKDDVEDFIENKFIEAQGPSLSEYVGSAGDRLRDITATLKSRHGFNGQWGWTNVFTFESNNNVFVWFTQTSLPIPIGATVNLTGTIKKHNEYKGEKTTQLTRCKVTEV